MAKQDVAVEANETVNAVVMAAAFEVAQPDFIRLKITTEIEVTRTYLADVQGHAEFIREHINDMADGLEGHVLSVDIA
jgi:hypothetical protein